MRLIDLALVRKDADGGGEKVQRSDLSSEEAEQFGAIVGADRIRGGGRGRRRTRRDRGRRCARGRSRLRRGGLVRRRRDPDAPRPPWPCWSTAGRSHCAKAFATRAASTRRCLDPPGRPRRHWRRRRRGGRGATQHDLTRTTTTSEREVHGSCLDVWNVFFLLLIWIPLITLGSSPWPHLPPRRHAWGLEGPVGGMWVFLPFLGTLIYLLTRPAMDAALDDYATDMEQPPAWSMTSQTSPSSCPRITASRRVCTPRRPSGRDAVPHRLHRDAERLGDALRRVPAAT